MANLNMASHKEDACRRQELSDVVSLSIGFLAFISLMLICGVYKAFMHDYVLLACILLLPYGWLVAYASGKLQERLVMLGQGKWSGIVTVLSIVKKIWWGQFFLLIICVFLGLIFYAIYGPFIGDWRATAAVGIPILVAIIQFFKQAL